VSDELRAAAERVANGEAFWTDYVSDEAGEEYPEHRRSEGWEEAARLVALAYLAEHPADDDQPPTPERLRAAGWVQSKNPDYLNYGEVPSGRVSICCRHPSRDEFRWALWNEKNGDMILLPPLRTMTAVRAWQRAVDATNAEGGAG
jgi:hypothetical protein